MSAVSITIHRAENLDKKDLGSKSDPYCEVILPDTCVPNNWKTSVKESTVEPTWNETMQAFITPNMSEITIKIWDKDPLSQDYMGRVQLKLNLDEPFVVHQETLGVKDGKGIVYVSYQIVPFKQLVEMVKHRDAKEAALKKALEDTTASLTTTINTLQGEKSNLENTIATLKGQIESAKVEGESDDATIARLNASLAQMTTENSDLKNQIVAAGAQAEEQQATITSLEAEVDALHEHVNKHFSIGGKEEVQKVKKQAREEARKAREEARKLAGKMGNMKMF